MKDLLIAVVLFFASSTVCCDPPPDQRPLDRHTEDSEQPDDTDSETSVFDQGAFCGSSDLYYSGLGDDCVGICLDFSADGTVFMTRDSVVVEGTYYIVRCELNVMIAEDNEVFSYEISNHGYTLIDTEAGVEMICSSTLMYIPPRKGLFDRGACP